MKIIKRTLDAVTVLELDGHLALEANAQFRTCVTAAIEAGARKLVVDLARVEYMDSCGLGELIACYTTLQKVSGRLTLLHLNHRLRHLLDITKLYTVFETFDSEAAAVSSFAPRVESEVCCGENTARLP